MIVHIFKPGSQVTLCPEQLRKQHLRGMHAYYTWHDGLPIKRYKTHPASEESEMCPRCLKEAKRLLRK